jgi:hypothetical protein
MLLVHPLPSGLFPHLAVLMLADLLAPLLDDGRHRPSLNLDKCYYTGFLVSANCPSGLVPEAARSHPYARTATSSFGKA